MSIEGHSESMVYVAADPNQPGAAWAIVVIDPRFVKDIAETLYEWVNEGAIVQCVDRDTGVAMLHKWVRPEKQIETQQAEIDL